MGDYQNSGIISANQKKRPGKRDPDIAGMLNNVVCPHCDKAADYWLNGWAKEGKQGKFYSLSVKPKESKTQAEHVEDGDIPF